MSSSREDILRAIRSHPIADTPLPAPFTGAIQYENPAQQFAEALKSVGGTPLFVRDIAEAELALQQNPLLAGAAKTCSLVAGLGHSNVFLEAIEDPHLLENVDWAILPARFGVAENGAVWLPMASLKHRVLPFITQHLVLVIPATTLVHNMHEAYTRLRFLDASFGAFISGPSKTADIEQSLVIGAHGARSLTVVVCEDFEAANEE